LIEDSTNRAINGAAAITSGTIVAVDPMVVPVISRVNGITAINKIKKGIERVIFTTILSTWLSTFIGTIPSESLVTSKTPIGNPIR
jgi:hypothetical protein